MNFDFTVGPKFVVIIPTLNEEKNIESVIKQVLQVVPGANILVVDDGSTDRTQQVVEEIGKKKPVFFLNRENEKTHGLSISVIHGILTLPEPDTIFAVMDGDGQHDPGVFPQMISLIENDEADIVVAARLSTPKWSFKRKMISWGANYAGKLRLSLFRRPSCQDVMSGCFAMEKETFLTLFEGQSSSSLQGFKILFDLLKGSPSSVRLKSVGYVFGIRQAGSSKIGSKVAIQFLKSVLS